MPNVISTKLRQKNISNLLQNINNESVYFVFSNPISWESGDNTPDIPVDSSSLIPDVYDDMLYCKKALLTNSSFVIRNYRWVSGARYWQYDNKADYGTISSVYDNISLGITLRPFYVVTDEYKVYKCLHNNYNSISSVKPTSVLTDAPTALADDYIWKYMFTIETPELDKFYTSNWIPVKTLTSDDTTAQWDVQAAAVHGAIHNIVIENAGEGYSTGTTDVIFSGGKIGATGITAVANATISAEGKVSSVSITNIGSHYIFEPTLSLVGGTTPAVLRAVLPPKLGHGADPVHELASNNIMIKTRVSGSEGSSIVDGNEYRQIALLMNPIFSGSTYLVGATGSYPTDEIKLNANHDLSEVDATYYPTTGKKIVLLLGTGAGQIREIAGLAGTVVTLTQDWDVSPAADTVYGILANSTVINQTVVLELSSPTGTFTPDSQVTQTTSGASGNVVMHDVLSTPQKLYLTHIIGAFNGTNSVSDGSVSANVTSVTQPTLERNSGDVLYLENRKPITRNVDQLEDIKIIIQD